MADKSRIEWCGATINVVYGCTPQSPGCDHCYAVRLAPRLGALTAGTYQDGAWTGKLNIFPERMLQACRWRKPRRIFVNSMGDLFHKDVPDTALDMVFAAMALCPQHTFVLLTKRPERMRDYFEHCEVSGWNNIRDAINHASLWGQGDRKGSLETPLPNVWLGVTAENQATADHRIPILLDIPATTRFVSVEPMLGPVDLHDGLWITTCDYTDEYESYPRDTRLEWVICGGETGPYAWPMHPDWVRGLRDQCESAGVPFFFKSWGEFHEVDDNITADGVFVGDTYLPGYGNTCPDIPSSGVNMCRVGKKRAGRLLDGREWNEFPEEQI